MRTVLGIHLGHHSSCAVVKDGKVAAALQQERVTRVKHDGQEGLSNRLPIRETLQAAGTSIKDVDLIVSSFQAASPGGIGLHRPLVHAGFDIFDPADSRHMTVSHHLAHGLSALVPSGFDDAAVLVCDLAGSTTLDGKDFLIQFTGFRQRMASMAYAETTQTECLSVYRYNEGELHLAHRESCVPHNAPDVFIQNTASLYDNAARMIFQSENAHGQMMALAAFGDPGQSPVAPEDIVQISDSVRVRFRNDWQARVVPALDALANAPFAAAVQKAFERALLAHARQAKELTGAPALVAAGGVFLNILGNSLIIDSRLFQRYYVPSSPHDAGISIGCAFAGWRLIGPRAAVNLASQAPVAGTGQPVGPGPAPDRLGPACPPAECRAAIREQSSLVTVSERTSPETTAELLRDGKIIARCAGRSEFGPRALGGRSLLSSPLLPDMKDRLNGIKGRQGWRPVAPVIPEERCASFFDGPPVSPYMNFVHVVRPEHQAALAALAHADGTTRAQTLRPEEDPFLHDVLGAFGELTGYPILVNTSLNGPGEPIVQTPEEAIDFLLAHPGVDLLALDDILVRRASRPEVSLLRLAPDTIVTVIYPAGRKRVLLVRRGASCEISEAAFELLDRSTTGRLNGADAVADGIERELDMAYDFGILIWVNERQRG
jgi:carbamoyltransferase